MSYQNRIQTGEIGAANNVLKRVNFSKTHSVAQISHRAAGKENKRQKSALTCFQQCVSPYAEKTSNSLSRRKLAWSNMDPNSNGTVSLSELETWIQQELVKKYAKTDGYRIWKYFRPIYVHAFNDARAIRKDENNDLLTKSEFRLCSSFLCFYASMADSFFSMDGANEDNLENKDRSISLEEWKVAFPKFLSNQDEYNFNAFASLKDPNVGTPESFFSKMDNNNQGLVLLSEWFNFLKMAEILSKTKIGIDLAVAKDRQCLSILEK